MRTPLVTIGGLDGGDLARTCATLTSPHSWGSARSTPSTGVYCPGCGGLRAVNDLTNGHLGAAASSNLLLVAARPGRARAAGRWAYASWRGEEIQVVPSVPRWLSTGLIVLAVVFVIVRNLPGSWLAP